MAFDPNTLLKPASLRAAAMNMGERQVPFVAIGVSDISPHIELAAFHRHLINLFERAIGRVTVDLREAFLLSNPLDPNGDRLNPQECKIILTPALECESSLPLIESALKDTYTDRGLMYDPRSVDIRILPPGF